MKTIDEILRDYIIKSLKEDTWEMHETFTNTTFHRHLKTIKIAKDDSYIITLLFNGVVLSRTTCNDFLQDSLIQYFVKH